MATVKWAIPFLMIGTIFLSGCDDDEVVVVPDETVVEPAEIQPAPYVLKTTQSIPSNALKYKRLLHRYALSIYGVNAPIALLAAQVHKESTWRADVCSPFACGLTQFTEGTANDVSKKFPALVDKNVFDPAWALQAMMLYDQDLKRVVTAIDECNDWAFTLAQYNGGPGWIWKEKNLVEKAGGIRDKYWDSVENVSARADWAKKENRGYPRKIILELQLLYQLNGWEGQVVCPNKV